MLPLYGGGFIAACVQLTALYYLAGLVLHHVIPRVFPVKGIQLQPRDKGDVARDAICSLGPIAVKAAIWTFVEQLHKRGYTKLYTGQITSIQDVLYIMFCIMLLDYAHDTWFYWTHRFLHLRPIYKYVHFEHHRSTSPSPFTGYSFHVLEALLVFANEVLVCFMIPLHLGVHRIYHLLTTLIHEAGHAGYELSPFIPTLEGVLSLMIHGLKGSSSMNTVQHHDMHHRYPTKHFSLYFTHWDRWCGTLHPKYDADLFTYFSS
eukprot:jgi/Chrzof1/14947/Cz09g21230.t1